VQNSGNVVVPAASVTARFTSNRAGSSYTHSVTGTTSTTGQVTITATKTVRATSGVDDCTMTVTAISKTSAEYVGMDPAITNNAVTLNW
jgi:hypothetical protein